jgi:lipopolysaccharide/colanic/teichoic acid biosynthesis glycosyltransferase
VWEESQKWKNQGWHPKYKIKRRGDKNRGVGILRFKTMVQNEELGYSFCAPLNAVSMVHG